MLELLLEFCSGILKVSPYILDSIKKALRGTQRSERGEKVAIAVKMPLKLIFSLYFIASIVDLLVAECMARLTI